jgi:cell division protein FtsB
LFIVWTLEKLNHMRLLTIILVSLLVLIQYPLWLGKGGWLRVAELDKQVATVQEKNDTLKARNAKLDSEVQDLKIGTEAVEERARFELGMVKKDEIFVQILDEGSKVEVKPKSEKIIVSPVLQKTQ